MRLVHSISMTLLVSALSSLSGCSSTPAPAGDGGGGTNASGTGGAGPTGGTGVTGGTGGSGVTGGAAGTGTSGTGGGANDHPADSTQAAIEAYLMTNAYSTTGMGWRPETMPSDGTGVPHGAVKRYFNETLIASKAAANTGSAHTVGSMVVKEILTGTNVIGKAVMLRGSASWVYYCMASEDSRCFTGSVANTATYATSGGTSCACHTNGNIVSSMVIPTP